MDKSLALSLVIGATVGAGLRSAVGATIAQVGRLGQAVQEAERQKAGALQATARVEKTERQLQSYRNLGREVLAAGRAHRDAQDKVRALAREIAASEAPTKAQEKALEAGRRAIVRAAAAEEAKKQRLAALRAELKAADIDTRNLGAAERKLAADLAEAKAKADQTTQSINRLGQAMAQAEKRRELGGEIRNQALKVGAAYMAIRQPVKAEGDFEHQLRAFGNTADMTSEELEKVRGQIRGMTTEVNQSNAALLGGVEVLVGKGMEAKTALAAIKDIGRAATATGASVEDMSNLSYSVMSNLHVPVDKLGKALDIMAQAGKEGGFELKNMAREFPQLTSAAAALGLTGTEAVASLGAALQVAMKGASDPSQAANNLANFLGKVTSEETVRNFRKHGIDIKQALADGVSAGENPVEVAMKEIAGATGADLDKAMADAFDENGKLVEGAAEKISERFKLGELFGDKQV
ncbi:MAG: phage tail tape measure protein, partial [Magnetospirillum sp.]